MFLGGNSPGSIETFTRPNNVTFGNLRNAIRTFQRQALNWTLSLNTTDLTNPLTVRMLNDQVMELERIFVTQLPLQNVSNHAILSYQKLNSYHGKATFPGIVNLLEEFYNLPLDLDRNDWSGWEKLRIHVTELYVMILQAASYLQPHHII